MALTASVTCEEPGCDQEFDVRYCDGNGCLNDNPVRCGNHPPVDRAGWSLIAFANGEFKTHPDGPLKGEEWQDGPGKLLWLGSGIIVGPNVPREALLAWVNFDQK